jgi:deoxyhypusine monooxygenase
VEALGAVFGARSALLKHEIAYVMGQMCEQQSVDILTDVLKVRSTQKQGQKPKWGFCS